MHLEHTIFQPRQYQLLLDPIKVLKIIDIVVVDITVSSLILLFHRCQKWLLLFST